MSRVFFTDRDLGTRFPEILRAAGLLIERHADHFPPDAADESWLAAVGRNDWVALTHDRRIRYKPNELAAVKRHGVALLVIVGQAPYPHLAHSFVATYPRVETFLDRISHHLSRRCFDPRPLSCVVTVRRRVELYSGIHDSAHKGRP